MQMASIGVASHLPMTRPGASYSPPEGKLIQETFSSLESPEDLPRALAALKSLGQTSDEQLSKLVHVTLSAVVAAGGAGPLALALCKAAFSALQEPGLKPATLAARLAAPLTRSEQNPVMEAIARAVTPFYGMAPGTQKLVDDVHLFLSPIHDGADGNDPAGRIKCVRGSLEKLSELDDDRSYAGYLCRESRDGAGGGQVGELAGRAFVGGVLVRRRAS